MTPPRISDNLAVWLNRGIIVFTRVNAGSSVSSTRGSTSVLLIADEELAKPCYVSG